MKREGALKQPEGTWRGETPKARASLQEAAELFLALLRWFNQAPSEAVITIVTVAATS